MKKVKIMLTVIALFAVVGGALAFKAKFNTKYCTAMPLAGGTTCPATCPNFLVGKPDASGINLCYTPTTNINGCATNPPACAPTPVALTPETE